jgi:hypothetical protein
VDPFTCYPVSDGHPYNGKIVGWAILRDGKIHASGALDGAQAKVLAKYPGAKFIKNYVVLSPEELRVLASSQEAADDSG